MDSKGIKKMLAGIGLAGLLSGAGLALTSATAIGGSGCSGKGGSGCSGGMKMDAKAGAMKMEAPTDADGAVKATKEMTEEEKAKAEEEAAAEAQKAATEAAAKK